MIFDSIFTGLFGLLTSFVNLFPAIPNIPNFDKSQIVNTIEMCGYLLPMQAMLATFGIGLAIKNWELFVSMVSWIWERIPFN